MHLRLEATQIPLNQTSSLCLETPVLPALQTDEPETQLRGCGNGLTRWDEVVGTTGTQSRGAKAAQVGCSRRWEALRGRGCQGKAAGPTWQPLLEST